MSVRGRVGLMRFTIINIRCRCFFVTVKVITKIKRVLSKEWQRAFCCICIKKRRRQRRNGKIHYLYMLKRWKKLNECSCAAEKDYYEKNKWYLLLVSDESLTIM